MINLAATNSKTMNLSQQVVAQSGFQLPHSILSHVMSGPDSVMVRAFASEAGGAGSNPGRVIPKTLKMVPVATLLGAQH